MEHKRQKENKSGRLNIGVNAIMNKSINNNGNPSHPNIGVNADTQPLPLSASGWHLKVFIRTFGCQMNTRDSEAVLGLFLERGYSVSLTAEGADVVLINTCSVREHAESRALSFAGTFKKLNEKGYVSRLSSSRYFGISSFGLFALPKHDIQNSGFGLYDVLASTLTGLPNFRAQNAGSRIWHPISPRAPVPKSSQPRQYIGA